MCAAATRPPRVLATSCVCCCSVESVLGYAPDSHPVSPSGKGSISSLPLVRRRKRCRSRESSGPLDGGDDGLRPLWGSIALHCFTLCSNTLSCSSISSAYIGGTWKKVRTCAPAWNPSSSQYTRQCHHEIRKRENRMIVINKRGYYSLDTRYPCPTIPDPCT